jgi:exopolyphosphatase/guanosine-5'-triphosphate,3'-diphosphate pyrophosphatase
MTQRFFRDGAITKAGLDAAEMAARSEIEAIAGAFAKGAWHEAYGSSGTAVALADILEQNAFTGGGVTPTGLARMRRHMLEAGHVSRLKLNALKGERAPVLAGGYAIMAAAVSELRIDRIDPVGGALRLGVLYDLLGRSIDEDARAATVERFIARYGIDRAQAVRVGDLAAALYKRASPSPDATLAKLVEWAGRLHEVGMSISHDGFHKHGAYIVEHADMPGFSSREQGNLAFLVLACRGRLAKVAERLDSKGLRAAVLALRLAVLVHHARTAMALPRITLRVAHGIRFGISRRWLAQHPLTDYLLAKERAQWAELGHPWRTAAG